MGANILVFLLTWPLEQSRQSVVNPDQYHEQIQELTKILLDPASDLKPEDRTILEGERLKEGYPTAATLTLFQSVNADSFALSREGRYHWSQLYPLFQSVGRSLTLHPGASTPFQTFGFRPNHGWFPGLLTHMFLHAGWLHIFFNMLFLWTVGLVLEPALGTYLLGLYVLGGVAAAGSQAMWGPPTNQIMVGASGAIAALMGFALSAMPSARVRLAYSYMISFVPRGGTFDSPLWFCLPLWILQQIFMFLMPLKGELGNVGYAAHIGGFAFGAAAGLLYRVLPSSNQ